MERNKGYCCVCLIKQDRLRKEAYGKPQGYVAPLKQDWEADWDWIDTITELGEDIQELLWIERKRKKSVIEEKKEKRKYSAPKP